MLPVVGEEVLIGFEHDDTTRPYVLGSLFNGQDTPGDDLLHGQDGSFVVRSDKQIFAASKEDVLADERRQAADRGPTRQQKYKQDWTEITQGIAQGRSHSRSTARRDDQGQARSVEGCTDLMRRHADPALQRRRPDQRPDDQARVSTWRRLTSSARAWRSR